MREKIKIFFCEENVGWYSQHHKGVENEPIKYIFKKGQDGKHLEAIEGFLLQQYKTTYPNKEVTDEGIMRLLKFMLDYHTETWITDLNLAMLRSQFGKIYKSASNAYKNEKAKKQTPTVQVIDKTKTGEAKRLREEHEKWLAEETAKRAATKQAGE